MSIFDSIGIQGDNYFFSTLLKLFLSFLLCGFIGFEREINKQPAGLRTHILIGLGSTSLMILSIYVPSVFDYLKNGDPTRIAAQVVSGIGFLGAGAIIRLGLNIKGLTTAASIWVVSAIGLVVGAGMYLEGFLLTFFALFTLIIIDIFEKKFLFVKELKILDLHFQGISPDINTIQNILTRFDIIIENFDISQSIEDRISHIRYFIHIPENLEINKVYNDLNSLSGITKMTYKQGAK